MDRLRRAVAFCALLMFVVQQTACGDHAGTVEPSQRPPSPDFRKIGEDGYIYGLPIVMAYNVMYEFAIETGGDQYKAPFNTLVSDARVFTPADTTIVTPNSDTPYSTIWMDLRAEPLVLTMPDIDPARYYSVQLCDANTFNYGYIGSRTTGNRAGRYLVVGPDWSGATPAGIDGVFRSGSQFSTAIYRTQLFDPSDLDEVKAVQTGYRAQTLSSYLGQPAPPIAPSLDFPIINDDLFTERFFDYLDFMLPFFPAGPEEFQIQQELGLIGVGPFKQFPYASLTADQKAQVQAGMKDGQARIDEYLRSEVTNLDGWTIGSFFGDRSFYSGDWLKRAAGARSGLFGNDAAEAVYPSARSLADGELLDGSKHNYTLTFPADDLPPARAFWSITIYDGKTQLLVANDINRYLINSPMLPQLTQNPDGSYTILIQKANPGPDKVSNWLPAPDGPIYLVMRLYWPQQDQPSILPPGEGSWSPPALVKQEEQR